MKNTSRKLASTLLALAMALTLFAAMPLTAAAASADELAETINNFDHGGSGTLTATASGDTVTVTGAVTGVKYSL
jgi:endonuclease YncB( thermonuclease family)